MLESLIIPRHLKPGDKVASVSLSWGGAGDPALSPRYWTGVRQLEETFGVKVVQMTNTLKGAEFIYHHPQARVDDLHQAFLDPSIKAVISVIGGDDSIRLIDKIDFTLLRNNPKIFLGFSDSTVTHFVCLKAGLRSYYGPNIVDGFDENTGLHAYLIDSVGKTLFGSDVIGELQPSEEGWTDERLDWGLSEGQAIKRKMHPPLPWRFLQGETRVSGRLLGGCTDGLRDLAGTSVWPSPDTWNGAILFIENFEADISPDAFLHILRSWGAMGILARINGLLFGRLFGLPAEKRGVYEDMLLKATKEFGRSDLAIVTQMDFGHTAPVFIIPYGAMASIDPGRRRFSIDEAGCGI